MTVKPALAFSTLPGEPDVAEADDANPGGLADDFFKKCHSGIILYLSKNIWFSMSCSLGTGRENLRGGAHDDRPGGDVFRDHAAGGNEGIFSNGHSRKQGGVGAYPGTLFEGGAAKVLFPFFGATEVVVVGEGHASDEAVIFPRWTWQ